MTCIVVAATARSPDAPGIEAALRRLDVEVVRVVDGDADSGIGAEHQEPGEDCRLALVCLTPSEDLEAVDTWLGRGRTPSVDDPARRVRPLVAVVPGEGCTAGDVDRIHADIAVCSSERLAALVSTTISNPLDAEDAAIVLSAHGRRTVVVDMGQQGAVVVRSDRGTYVPPFTVDVVDMASTAPVFYAAFALAVVEGLDLFASAGYALAAAAVRAGRAGGDEALPTRDDVERMAHSVDLRRDPGTDPVTYPR